MMAKHMMAKQMCSNVSQLLCWPLQTPLGKLMAIMMGFIICWLRRRTLLRLQHLRQTQVSCQQCRAAVNVTYAMVCHSSDGRFYCKDCWQDVGVSSNHAKLIAYPPKTVYCAGCTEPSHRLLLPDLSQQLSPAATWTCDKCFDTTQKGGNRALLWFNLAPSPGETENATKSGPLFYVTDFEFPTGGAPGLMKNHLVARMRSSSRRVLFVNHRKGSKIGGLGLTSREHVWNIQELQATGLLHEPPVQREAYHWLVEEFPASGIVCPVPSYYHLPSAVDMLPLFASDGYLQYEPMASHEEHLQRLCTCHHVQALTNLHTNGQPLDLRQEMQACNADDVVLFLGEYSCCLSYACIM